MVESGILHDFADFRFRSHFSPLHKKNKNLKRRVIEPQKSLLISAESEKNAVRRLVTFGYDELPFTAILITQIARAKAR